jgi:hypothetical protein
VLEHADMVKPFLRAIDKAMPECIKDPRFGVRVMNEARGFGRQYDEIEGIKTDITVGKHPEITGPGGFYTNEDTKKYGYGCIRKNKLQELIDLLDEAHLLAKKIKPEDVYMEVDFR